MRFLFSTLLLSAGCADYALDNAELAPGNDTARVMDTFDTGEEDPDSGGEPRSPAWYVVRAELAVENGAPSAQGAQVTLDVVDADLVRTDCIVELATDGIVAGDAATDDSVPLWWELPVVPATETCALLPETLVIGLGAMVPDVRAQLGTVDHDDIAESLYAAFLLLDGDAAAFGYAGTVTDLLGDDAATNPPPDGLYQLAPLYLVPLPQ